MAQDIQWEKSFGGKHSDYLFDAIPTADYGFILAGSTFSSESGNKKDLNKGNLDYCLWKINSQGEIAWQRSYGGDNADLLNCVQHTSDGGFILGGTSYSGHSTDKTEDSRGTSDYWVIKLDAAGSIQWQKTIGGKAMDNLVKVVETKSGEYLLGGSSNSDVSGEKKSSNRGGLDYWVICLTNSGEIKWQKTFGGMYNDELKDMVFTSDGGMLVAGNSNSPISGEKTDRTLGESDIWILKLNRAGDIEWQKNYGGENDDSLSSIITTNDGGYLLGGSSNSQGSVTKKSSAKHGSDFWLVKIDQNGEAEWEESYDIDESDILTSLVQEDDGSFIIGGYSKGDGKKADSKSQDYIFLRTNEKGLKLSDEAIGSDGEDVLKKLIRTRDGDYILAGTSNPEKTVSRHENFLSEASDRVDTFIHSDNDPLRDTTQEISNLVNESVASTTNNANEAVSQKENSAQIGLNPQNDLFNLGRASSSQSQQNTTKRKLPLSRQKSNNLGRNDFWVIKLKDKKKKKEVSRKRIEASPNPTKGYSNIIIGYEFQSGTATVYDLSGRNLLQVPITDNTVPIDLSPYPVGIYIVQINTNKGTDSVKIMRH